MKVIKHPCSLPITNHDCLSGCESKRKRHGDLLPDSIRCLIIGPSNSGKSNVMLSLLLHENGLCYENVYVYCKTLHQPKYLALEKIMKPVKGLGYYTFSTHENIPDKPKPNSIFIFDDIACENHDSVRKYFAMGRHNGVCSFLICQSYVRCPRHLIRENANLLILFPQDLKSMKHIFLEHVGSELSFEQFKELCHACWREKYGFLTINKDDGTYRKGLDQIFVINESDREKFESNGDHFVSKMRHKNR